jgi:hypothetical protein
VAFHEHPEFTASLVSYVGTMPDEDPNRLYGFVFMTNARGEPLEFAWSVARRPDSRLWGRERAHRATVRKLALSILGSTSVAPTVILFRSPDFPPGMIGTELVSDAPVSMARVGRGDLIVVEGELRRTIGDVTVSLSGGDGPAQSLIETIATRGLLWEPFERGEVALRELLAVEGRPAI